jgi:hypothetical protein
MLLQNVLLQFSDWVSSSSALIARAGDGHVYSPLALRSVRHPRQGQRVRSRACHRQADRRGPWGNAHVHVRRGGDHVPRQNSTLHGNGQDERRAGFRRKPGEISLPGPAELGAILGRAAICWRPIAGPTSEETVTSGVTRASATACRFNSLEAPGFRGPGPSP